MFVVPNVTSASSQYQQFLYQPRLEHLAVGNLARGILGNQVPLEAEDGSTETAAQSPVFSDHLNSVASMQNINSMLRNALFKEVDDRKRYVYVMNKKLEESEKMKKSLQLRVDNLVNEKRATDEMNFKVALNAEVTQNQLTDLQSQLNTLQDEVKELKEAKMSLEMDLNESNIQLEAANIVIQKFEVNRAFSEKKVSDYTPISTYYLAARFLMYINLFYYRWMN
jgi:chromosome segregation ATPase